MKTSLTGIILILLTVPLFAQKPLVISEAEISFSHGKYNGFSMLIPEVSYEPTAKEWVKALEKGTKSKITVVNGEYSIFGAQVPAIYENPINIYSILSIQDSGVLLGVTIEIKPKEFISRQQSEKEYALAENFIFRFGKEQYVNLAKEELKNEEKKLKDLEREYTSLQETKIKLEKTIIEEQNNIIEYNDKIIMLQQDTENLNDRIGNEKSALVSLESEEVIQEKEGIIKSLEKEKNRAFNEIENLQKKIIDSNSAIDRSNLDIESNGRDQSLKTNQIDAQKQVVNRTQLKLDTISNY